MTSCSAGGRSTRSGCASTARDTTPRNWKGNPPQMATWPSSAPLALGGRADDAVVAHRARRVGGRRLEALREDAVGDGEDGVGDPVAVDLRGRHRHLLVVEDVVVALAVGVDLPGLARADGIERQLHVLAQLRRAAGPSRLVVDELVAAAGQLVDAVDAAAERVRAHAELEPLLEPHGLGVLAEVALVVALHRRGRLAAQLALLL